MKNTKKQRKKQLIGYNDFDKYADYNDFDRLNRLLYDSIETGEGKKYNELYWKLAKKYDTIKEYYFIYSNLILFESDKDFYNFVSKKLPLEYIFDAINLYNFNYDKKLTENDFFKLEKRQIIKIVSNFNYEMNNDKFILDFFEKNHIKDALYFFEDLKKSIDELLKNCCLILEKNNNTKKVIQKLDEIIKNLKKCLKMFENI